MLFLIYVDVHSNSDAPPSEYETGRRLRAQIVLTAPSQLDGF